jgi:hypothetical protein
LKQVYFLDFLDLLPLRLEDLFLDDPRFFLRPPFFVMPPVETDVVEGVEVEAGVIEVAVADPPFFLLCDDEDFFSPSPSFL